MTRRARGERGESLVELLVTIMIMSTAIISIIAGIAVASESSDEQKKQTGTAVVLHDYAEAIMAGSYPGGCADPVVNYTPPAGYTVGIKDRAWYSGTSSPPSFSSTCPGAAATAIRLTLEGNSSDDAAHQTLEIVKGVDYVRPSP